MRRTPVTLTLAAILSAHAAADPGTDFFENKVRPLLAQRCSECHSAEKKVKGGLRLDSREAWIKGGDTGPAITPGQPEASLLIEAVRYANRDLQMPPKQKLPGGEIAILEQWIAMGAPDPRSDDAPKTKQRGLSLEEGRKFWCYQPLHKADPPNVQHADWPLTAIDRFLLARMEKDGIQAAPDATLPVLARRLSFALTGLPPSPEQVDTLLTDTQTQGRNNALSKMVDELLASPHFGETWGSHWLDIARFAESSGGGRTLLFKDAWRYRDYVRESFNSGLPIHQFIREQIAGDLLPHKDTDEQRRHLIATGFLALGPTNYEEQYKQQLRFDIIDEQIDTLGRSLLGQTLGCARCHDHKFDPVPQHDYYALAGIFASTRTLHNYTDNVARWITHPLPAAPEDEPALQAHEQHIASLQSELKAAQTALAKASKNVAEASSSPGRPIAPSELPGIVLDDQDAKVVGQWKHSTHVRSYVGKGYLTDDNKEKGACTITFTPQIPKTARYDLRLAYAHAQGRANNVRINILHADGEDTVFIDQSGPPPIDGRFVSLGKFRFEKDGAGYVLISNADTKGYVTVDALQLIEEDAPPSPALATTTGAPSKNPASKTPQPPKEKDSPERARVKSVEAEIKNLTTKGPKRDTAMIVREDDAIADTQIRVRGIERQRGPSVPRGFLQVALAGPAPALPAKQSGRLELAEWLVSSDNPLTARVLVNRVWFWLFGAGIVRTVDNFGTTGELPTHPELLDHLALQFIQEGWNLKTLVREIVLSRAWQLSVQPPSKQDPENHLFARANRRRLNAEEIRDAILHASGRIDLAQGGPNIAGAGDIDANTSSAQNIEYAYQFTDLRRSFYTPAFRNKRLEAFEVFDFANINQPVGQRNVSTVAPQALYLLNSPFVRDQARAAAQRTMALAASDPERIDAAYMRILGRQPSERERTLCTQYLATNDPGIEGWTQIHQMLFASIDFRYLD